MTKFSLLIATTSCFIGFASVAHARSAYDGPWELAFVTQRGTCDSSYSFTVDVTNGIITHPNLVRFRGHVANSGSVRASVTVQDKYASGAGKLSASSGHGTWSGQLWNGTMLWLLDGPAPLRGNGRTRGATGTGFFFLTRSEACRRSLSGTASGVAMF